MESPSQDPLSSHSLCFLSPSGRGSDTFCLGWRLHRTTRARVVSELVQHRSSVSGSQPSLRQRGVLALTGLRTVIFLCVRIISLFLPFAIIPHNLILETSPGLAFYYNSIPTYFHSLINTPSYCLVQTKHCHLAPSLRFLGRPLPLTFFPLCGFYLVWTLPSRQLRHSHSFPKPNRRTEIVNLLRFNFFYFNFFYFNSTNFAMLALVSLLFAGQVTAGVLGDVARLGRRVDPEEAMRRYVDTIVEPIERRQTTTAGMNVTQWNVETEALCTAQLEALNGVASNPSGMAVCYNLPALDNTTGVFMADLRLYMIAAPTGTFANIASTNVQVGLSYNGATVSAINSSTLTKRADETSLISWPRSELIENQKRAAMVPLLIQSYAFVGQVNKELLTANMGT